MTGGFFEEAQRNQRWQASHKSPSVSSFIRSGSASIRRARCLRRALQAINQPADLTADVLFGKSMIVALRVDILLEHAKKILVRAGLDQPERRARQVAYAEAPRKPAGLRLS
jgi:hypothetical protein